MNSRDDIRSLASYVTYRELYNEGKTDVYSIISKFEENIIFAQGMYRFGVTDLAGRMEEYYSFKIPSYILQTALKKLDYVKKEHHNYIVDGSRVEGSNDFEKNYQEAYLLNDKLMTRLRDFALEKTEFGFEKKDEAALIREFCNFLLDESYTGKYAQLIGTFIIENSSDSEMGTLIKTIKEGAVLYAGINYSTDVSKKNIWNEKITIYLEQEIIFHLAGYNGEVFKQVSNDLLKLISEMNQRQKDGKVIYLKYFKETKDEIEDFFGTAEQIVSHIATIDDGNIAMKSIVDGCTSPSDVLDKKTSLYRMLQAKGIMLDETQEYYSKSNYDYNIESVELEEKYQINGNRRHYLKHINYINILRKGEQFTELKRAKFILLTETGKILQASSDVINDSSKVPLAINMYLLTNRLWFDLNKGFGANDLPSSFDILVRSKIVLSNILNKSISDKYESAKKQYEEKKISREELVDRIVTLRETQKLPEQIDASNLDAINGFISEEEVDIYKSEKEKLTSTVADKDNEIERINAELKDKDELLTLKQSDIEKMREEKNNLLAINNENKMNYINSMKQRKGTADKKIKRKWSRVKVASILVLIGVYIGGIWLYNKFNLAEVGWIEFAIAMAPILIGSIILVVEKKNHAEILFMRIKNRLMYKWTCKYYSEYGINIDELNSFDEESAQSA